MRRKLLFLGFFLMTFLIGYLVVPKLIKNVENEQFEKIVQIYSPIIPTVQAQEAEVDKDAEIFWEEDIDKMFKIKLLETGEFHGDEVKAKSGEIWLGLFKQGNNYFLQSAKIQVKKVHDVIVDEKDWQKTGKSVSVSNKKQTVFLLKNANILKKGKVKTVFDVSQEENQINMPNGFSQNFELNGEKYLLRVENDTAKDEFLTKGSKLILSKAETKQVLAYLQDGCDDCYWTLYWVGDLDQDGKLDFYFDLSNHYNTTNKTLFLSSEAKKGKLVKKVSQFWTTGC